MDQIAIQVMEISSTLVLTPEMIEEMTGDD